MGVVTGGAGRMRAADQTARFEVLIQPLLTGAFGLAYSMLGDRQAAEDVVQEAAAKAWRSIAMLREDASPQPWFFVIVANQCRDARRGSRRLVWSLSNVPEPAMGDHADRVARDLDLERALARLSPQGRGLLFLRYQMDMPPSQIAEVLHWRVGTVKSRLHRTLRKLEAELAPSPMEESR
jgi:RNA polymerase sigma-70 factor (ECF subfamily)